MFSTIATNFILKWDVHSGPNFELLEGTTEGQTQVNKPFEGEPSIWAQPLDIHYACKVKIDESCCSSAYFY